MTKRKLPVVRWHFADGRDMDQPLADFEQQRIRQYAAMALSDDPVLRADGERGLREAAKRAAAGTMRQVQPVAAAKEPRAGARSTLRQRIVEIMRRERANNTSFKVLMGRWEREEIGDVTMIFEAGGRYTAISHDKSRTYAVTTLQKMFSE